MEWHCDFDHADGSITSFYYLDSLVESHGGRVVQTPCKIGKF